MKITLCKLIAALSIATSGMASAEPSSYAGQETRQIKALSTEEVHGYLSGKGMGLAKAAELNGYPGPAHVLALANELDLNADQRAKTQAVFAAMSTDAASIGTTLIDTEHRLDRSFAEKTIDQALLAELLDRIGALQAQLRGVHLSAHLAQVTILTPDQRKHYDQLRGYSGIKPPAAAHVGHAHH